MSETSKLTVGNANISQELVFGRLTTAERDSYFAANPPDVGMLIFNDDDKVLEMWNGTEWLLALGERIGGGGGSLYEFSTVTFNPGQSGRSGPNLSQIIQNIQGNDAWKSNTEYLNVENGIITWTVPARGDYKIECTGAQGGRSNGWGVPGGQGAYATGTFTLRAKDKLKICVGQQGSGHYYEGGGGGGSFVVMADDNSPLVCAGGGGGGSASGMNGPGPFFGHTSETGGATAWFSGGSSGSGGGGGTAGGGGGLTGNGGGSWGGQSFTNGAVGGPYIDGGFGGGGGGGGTYGAGGGGGYSGGAASYWSFYGAGGGSYVDTAAKSPTKTSNNKAGNGQVIITKV